MGLHSSLAEGGALSPRARPQQQACPSPTPCVEPQRQGAAGCRARGAQHGGSERGEALATGQQEAPPQIGAPGHQVGPAWHSHPSTPPHGGQTGRWARSDRPLTRAPQPRTPAAQGPAEPWGHQPACRVLRLHPDGSQAGAGRSQPGSSSPLWPTCPAPKGHLGAREVGRPDVAPPTARRSGLGGCL